MTVHVAAAGRQRPKDRKDRILSAAAERFATRGFVATGIEDIAADVEVTGATIYRHFAGKDSVLAAVVTDAADSLLKSLESVTPQGHLRAARLKALIEAAVTVALSRPAHYASYVRERGRLSGESARHLRDINAKITQIWTEAADTAGLRLGSAHHTLRQQTASIVLADLARTNTSLTYAERERLIARALLALWQCPPVMRSAPPVESRSWTAPVSRSDAIMIAALAMFRQRGFHDVGMDDIAETLGMAASGLYRYFPSKVDILVDADDRAAAHLVATIDDALSTAADARDALDRMIQSFVRVVLDSLDFILVVTRNGAALPESELPRSARRGSWIRSSWASVLQQLRPDLQEPEARLLVHGLLHLVVEAANVQVELPDPALEISEMALAYLLHGT